MNETGLQPALRIMYDAKTGSFGHEFAPNIPLSGLIAHLELLKSLLVDQQKMAMMQEMQEQTKSKLLMPNGVPMPRLKI